MGCLLALFFTSTRGVYEGQPPSATSPPRQTVQYEGVVESMPLPVAIPTPTPTSTTTTTPTAPTTTLELIAIPPPIMQLMRGFNERLSPGESSGVPRSEGMPYYLGAFLGVALEWHAQAKSKAGVPTRSSGAITCLARAQVGRARWNT